MTFQHEKGELHEMNPTGRFSERAADYVRYRPSYPDAAIDAILRDLGDPHRLVAADVGAGTGISARLLAEQGVRVLAVEPNAEMRAGAVPLSGIDWRDGRAEATGLDDGSVGLVLCAQAFHWFRQPEAVAEFHRILRPRGRLTLMWNQRDIRDPMTLGYIEAIRAVNGEHPAETRGFDPQVVHESGRFTEPRLETFEYAQELDGAGLVGRARSASYVPKEGPASETLRRILTELHERHRDSRGLVKLRYRTVVWLSERL